MKWHGPKSQPYSLSRTWTGRKNGFKLEVEYNDFSNHFYFLGHWSDKSYNSLWDKHSFTDFDSCAIAAEKWAEERAKEIKG